MSRPVGFKHTDITKKKLSLQKIGNKNPEWKGDDVGYKTLHQWIQRWKGKTKICIKCGTSKKVCWANKNHKYSRDLNMWISLCPQCHWDYDKKYNGRIKKGGRKRVLD